ncbi:BrnA antitoxin family protein [Sulfitobacter sp. DSM 110093]|uniref:BrnA antitoxin family protein n=1 Tax=Sulfitobacter sp. DSM 110093 TaxID=2883127 RepID=UPI001FADB49F|nr:BrnA antitoxin family protein [Sulfitobacter sp. DSM 110093]
MSENKKHMPTASEDDAPDLNAPYWADKSASATLQRGRPKAEGSGWQSRINDALRKVALTNITAQAKTLSGSGHNAGAG